MSGIESGIAQVAGTALGINAVAPGLGGDITGGFKNMFGFERYQDRSGPFEQRSQDVANMLYRRATGQSPSLAEMQTRQALEDNLQNTITGIKSGSGVSPALRQRQISRAQERAGTQIARKGMEARLAEQMGTERTLASLMGAFRGQDVSGFQAEQDRRNLLKEVARGGGQALGTMGTGGAGGAGAGGAVT